MAIEQNTEEWNNLTMKVKTEHQYTVHEKRIENAIVRIYKPILTDAEAQERLDVVRSRAEILLKQANS